MVGYLLFSELTEKQCFVGLRIVRGKQKHFLTIVEEHYKIDNYSHKNSQHNMGLILC